MSVRVVVMEILLAKDERVSQREWGVLVSRIHIPSNTDIAINIILITPPLLGKRLGERWHDSG